MSDRRMKRIFREAAEVARSVPVEFRQAAFDKAVDLLRQQDREQRLVAEDEGGRTTRVQVTGYATPDMLIDKYIEALAFAANRLGLEAASADQVAEILNDRFGLPTPASVVSTALSGAGIMVRTARVGGKTLYKLASPLRKPPAYAGPERRRDVPPIAPAQKVTVTARKKPGKVTKKSDKKPRKTPDSPAEILNDLITLGFFTTAKTTADVLLYLEKQGLEITSRQVAPILLRLMQAGLLGRSRAGNGYRYYAE